MMNKIFLNQGDMYVTLEICMPSLHNGATNMLLIMEARHRPTDSYGYIHLITERHMPFCVQ